MGSKTEVLLDSHQLQKNLRMRLSKQIFSNTPVHVGTVFNINYNPALPGIILRVFSAKTCKNDNFPEVSK
ncbi:MAG: hypothetical protein J5590_07300 [Clostridia bacterium]|nr:hypothetical protein [Clostridia bacterium]